MNFKSFTFSKVLEILSISVPLFLQSAQIKLSGSFSKASNLLRNFV